MSNLFSVRITDDELARDLPAVMAKVRQGMEVIVEHDHRPVAVIKPPEHRGRRTSEILAAMKAGGANAVADEDFARDVEEGIASHQQPWNPPSWE